MRGQTYRCPFVTHSCHATAVDSLRSLQYTLQGRHDPRTIHGYPGSVVVDDPSRDRLCRRDIDPSSPRQPRHRRTKASSLAGSAPLERPSVTAGRAGVFGRLPRPEWISPGLYARRPGERADVSSARPQTRQKKVPPDRRSLCRSRDLDAVLARRDRDVPPILCGVILLLPRRD